MEELDETYLKTLLLSAHYDDLVDNNQLGGLSLLNKFSLKTCKSSSFWIEKAMFQLNKDITYFQTKNGKIIRSAKEKYLKLYTLIGGVAKGSESYIDDIEFTIRSLLSERYYLLEYAISKSIISWGYAIYISFRQNNNDRALTLLNLAPTDDEKWKNVLIRLSLNDPILFDLLDKYLKIKCNYTPNYTSLLHYSISNNNYKIIEHLINAAKESSKEYSSKEYSSKEYSSKEYSSKEYSSKEYSSKEYSSKEYSSKEYSSKEYSRV